jgi:hypothetical protein
MPHFTLQCEIGTTTTDIQTDHTRQQDYDKYCNQKLDQAKATRAQRL